MAQYEPLTFYTIASDILACIQERLDEAGQPELNRACVVPGQVAWDQCQCGQLTISNPTQFNSNVFPAPIPGGDQTMCGASYAVSTFTATLLRCIPVSDANGNPPPCSTLDATAQIIYKDKYYMRAAILCCLAAMQSDSRIELFTVGTTTDVGPEGGCVGSELSFSVGLINNCPC